MIRICFLLLLLVFACKSQDDVAEIINNPGGIVNDYANILTTREEKTITDKLFGYEKETTRQMIVVIVDSIAPYDDIVKLATDIGNSWGVGQKETDNGLVILVCNKCRKVAIATGTGTEKQLTNEVCQKIIENQMIPNFKNGKFYEGLNQGIDELIKQWQ